jgi:hypothetical protein
VVETLVENRNLSLLTLDELNQLCGYRRSTPIDKYFNEMHLSRFQKEQRISFAERIEDEMVYALSFLFQNRDSISEYAVELFRSRFAAVLNEYSASYQRQVETALKGQQGAPKGVKTLNKEINVDLIAFVAASQLATSTEKHKNDPYYYSNDRARLIAEEETNSIWNESDFADEKQNGATEKTWATMGDNGVRNSHAAVDGLTIPIDEPFELDGGLLMYPRDSSLGAADSEIAGCRCWLEFT